MDELREQFLDGEDWYWADDGAIIVVVFFDGDEPSEDEDHDHDN